MAEKKGRLKAPFEVFGPQGIVHTWPAFHYIRLVSLILSSMYMHKDMVDFQ